MVASVAAVQRNRHLPGGAPTGRVQDRTQGCTPGRHAGADRARAGRRSDLAPAPAGWGGGYAGRMDDQSSQQAPAPVGHARVVYLGPVAPHWEVQSDYGDPEVIEAFRERVLARLVLLPPHDPQFRRNRERVVRDAERENLELEWDLGFPEETESAEAAE